MSAAAVIIVVLACEGLVLLTAATSIGRRVHDAHDFFLAGRGMGAWRAAGSECFGALGALSLLAVVGAAFEWGLSAVWIGLGLLLGFLLQWTYVGPRLYALSREQGSATLLQVVTAGDGPNDMADDRASDGAVRRQVIGSAVFIVCAAFLCLGVAELRFFGDVLEQRYDLSAELAVAFAIAVVAVYSAMGGIAATSAADSLQSILLGAVMIGCAVSGVVAVGGWQVLRSSLHAIDPQLTLWLGGRTDVVAAAFVCGTVGIGLNQLGQPHALQRFMILRDAGTLRQARWLALGWSAIILAAAILTGWYARIRFAAFVWRGQALFELAHRTVSAPLEGAIVALWLGAVAAAVGSQLVVVSACIAVDLRGSWPAWSAPGRTAVVLFAAASALLALYLPLPWPKVGLNAWGVLGASFGPLLLIKLIGQRIRPRAMLGAMWAGCLLTVMFHWLPAGPGDFLDRLLPFAAAFSIALSGNFRQDSEEGTVRSRQ